MLIEVPARHSDYDRGGQKRPFWDLGLCRVPLHRQTLKPSFLRPPHTCHLPLKSGLIPLFAFWQPENAFLFPPSGNARGRE
eukprot:COSAG06_NODE_2025_length_7808_cov_3.765728_4_plen_81_part_00